VLSLPEEFLLLALDDQKGSFAAFTDYGLAGAVLVELLLRDAITVGPKGEVLAGSSPQGDAALDAALAAIGQLKKPKKLQEWVGSLPGRCKTLKPAVLDGLVAQGVLRREDRRFLRVFAYTRYPEADGAPEDAIVGRLRRVLLDGQEPDGRTAALIGLLHGCQMDASVLRNRAERKTAKPILDRITKGDIVSSAVSSAVAAAIAAACSAAMTCCIAASVAASSSS